MSTKEDQEGRGAVVLGVVAVCLVIAAGFAADAHHYWSAAAEFLVGAALGVGGAGKGLGPTMLIRLTHLAHDDTAER